MSHTRTSGKTDLPILKIWVFSFCGYIPRKYIMYININIYFWIIIFPWPSVGCHSFSCNRDSWHSRLDRLCSDAIMYSALKMDYGGGEYNEELLFPSFLFSLLCFCIHWSLSLLSKPPSYPNGKYSSRVDRAYSDQPAVINTQEHAVYIREI